MILFLVLLLVNCIAVLIYFLFCRHRVRSEKMSWDLSIWIRIAVMLLCPVAGFCFFLFGNFLFRTVFRSAAAPEDAIPVSDTEDPRTLNMNEVRQKLQDSLAAIALALNREDPTDVHDTASALQEALEDFRSNVQNAYEEIQAAPADQLDYAEIILEYMNPVLLKKVFTETEQKLLVNRMDEIGDLLYEFGWRKMKSIHFEAISMRLLELGDIERCREWCERAEYHFPYEPATYTCLLKLYFQTGNRSGFFRVLEDLKDTDIILDHETLELIRMFK